MEFKRWMKEMFWKCPFVPGQVKEKIYFEAKKYIKGESGTNHQLTYEELLQYRNQILSIPTGKDDQFYKEITKQSYYYKNGDPKLIAYYLTQFHPTPQNDKWWGKGVTEWNNVCRAVPQYLGHYQPRLPGELGFYDLRLKDNMVRQVELAKMYGIYAFCFYFYWFDGKRLLEKPLNLFLNNKDINFPFCLCWANESWTRAFFGSSREIIMKQSHTVESYKKFIEDAAEYLKDPRYLTVNGKKVILIYKPHDVPKCKEVLAYWRSYCREHGIGELYIMGCWMCDNRNEDFMQLGFDAISEFQLGATYKYLSKINNQISFITNDYYGEIYSYADLVKEMTYRQNWNIKKLYSAISPMWDNTPRRNNKGSMIFHGSTPKLYKTWLKDIIRHNQERTDLDDNLIFVNAWNEWGEGAYLEPDKRFGYAYLQATKEAIEESRQES